MDIAAEGDGGYHPWHQEKYDRAIQQVIAEC